MILFQNYSSDLCTEPMYLHGCFSRIGVAAGLWNSGGSVFDIMDSNKPEVLVCHYRNMTSDLFKYFARNDRFKCDVVINITGATQAEFDMVEQTVKNAKMSVPFYFSNIPASFQQVASVRSKVVNILPAVDLFLNGTDKGLNFEVEAGIISMNQNELVKQVASKYPTHHKLKLLGAATPDPDFDLPVNIMNLTNLYGRYEKVILADIPEVIFTQLFFEAVHKSKRVLLRTLPEHQDKLDRVLTQLFFDPGTSDGISETVKKQIKLKHTCFSRASRFCQLLGQSDMADQFRKIAEE